MIIYQSSKIEFVDDVKSNRIADGIDRAFVAHLGRHTSPNEINSWRNSMMFMSNVIDISSIPNDAGIAIEYQIPLTSKRIDFIISGLDEEKKKNVIIIELKQWERATLTNKPGIITTRFQHGEHETAHPSYQAWSYAYMLNNYNETVEAQNILISPCAYLHNYKSDSIIDHSFYQEYIEKAPLFLKYDTQKLQNFIQNHIKYGDKDDIVWLIDNGRLRPSKQLSDALCSMLKGKQEFLLLDDQKIVYETALDLERKSREGKKHVLIIEGGPGTGKTVVAINLLVELTKNGRTAQYVSKNAAPRDVYTAKLSESYKKGFIHNLFVGSGSFIDMQENTLDALIVDEAHRLNFKSGLYGNLGENQIKEIIRASKFSVFFVDDRQKIHIKDIGSKNAIKKYAEECGAVVHFCKLSSQFRCNGSEGYLNWLDNTLQIQETANIRLSQEDYDFRIFNDPNELFDAILEKNRKNNKSRVVAGYCWDWKSKKDSNAYDIIIPSFSFQKRWNLSSDKNLWIIGPESVNEIGCIHTCQGLEMDYVGVIVGNDLRYEDAKVITDIKARSRNDQSVKGFGSLLKTQTEQTLHHIDEIIKNTYRTLMTRGMKGCYVYFCDPALAQYFQNRLIPLQEQVSEIIEEGIRIEPEVDSHVKYIDFLPVYSIKAACGYFGEGEDVEERGWVKVEGMGRLNRNMYVVEAVGHSMEPIINDRDLCVFRANPAGSRQGKIVLTQHRNFYDVDNSGGYSIKIYTSKKRINEFGEWEHDEIILEPKNKDYTAIVIDEDDSDDFRVVGEFIGVIK
ncbi:MAG: DNA/RNA helicase domain-containing protein [Marinifilaceae bacterium]